MRSTFLPLFPRGNPRSLAHPLSARTPQHRRAGRARCPCRGGPGGHGYTTPTRPVADQCGESWWSERRAVRTGGRQPPTRPLPDLGRQGRRARRDERRASSHNHPWPGRRALGLSLSRADGSSTSTPWNQGSWARASLQHRRIVKSSRGAPRWSPRHAKPGLHALQAYAPESNMITSWCHVGAVEGRRIT